MARGKYGRRPPKNAPALKLGRLLTGTVPAHPAAADYLGRLSGWQMLGNDVAGDCNAVTWANMRRLVTATLSRESYPSQAEVWEFYRTQNPGFDPSGSPDTDGPGGDQDQGMEIQSGLEYLAKHGGPDGVKAVAFAKVDHTNMAEIQAALAIFGCLWLGILVLDQNQDQFSEGVPWTGDAGDVDGGHAVLAGGYNPGVKFITWGAEADFSLSFWNGSAEGEPLVEEAWVVIWPEQMGSAEFLAGVDLAALAVDYTALTGRPFPAPVPSPQPTPAPAPVPLTAAQVLWQTAGPWCAHGRTRPDLVELKAALETFAAAEGLG